MSYEIQWRSRGVWGPVWEPRWNTFTLKKAFSDLRDMRAVYRGDKFRIVKVTRKVIAAK